MRFPPAAVRLHRIAILLRARGPLSRSKPISIWKRSLDRTDRVLHHIKTSKGVYQAIADE